MWWEKLERLLGKVAAAVEFVEAESEIIGRYERRDGAFWLLV